MLNTTGNCYHVQSYQFNIATKGENIKDFQTLRYMHDGQWFYLEYGKAYDGN